jgi:hypothetical protein
MRLRSIAQELRSSSPGALGYARLVRETAAWEKRRNAERDRINWMFTTENARAKLGRA